MFTCKNLYYDKGKWSGISFIEGLPVRACIMIKGNRVESPLA